MTPTERYQDIILDAMARTLWLLAYADWAERRREEGEDEDAEGGGELEVSEPGPGQDWDDFAPETPLAAVQAAGDLYTLICESQGLPTGARKFPLGKLFEQAMATHLGRPMHVYDEPWHSQLKAATDSWRGDADSRQALALVYADWLEEQGRAFDATYVRDRVEKRESVIDITGHEGDAKRFGSVLVHMSLGTGVHWGDDYKTWRKHPDEAKGDWTKKMPSFTCRYTGHDLVWHGHVREAAPNNTGRGGIQVARYEEGGYRDLPTTEGPDEVGDDVGHDHRHVIIVNASDKSFAKHSFVLWFGTTNLLIYANSLEDALDEGIDWLVENEPGQIVDDEVNERFAELQQEREQALGHPLTWDNDNEEMSNISQEAEEDTTSGGNAGNHINRDAWGIQMEDPSERDLLLFTGLIKNPPRKKKPKQPLSAYDYLATVMFRDTVTARMLRELARREQMTQAEFMRNYMRRCERPPSAWELRAAAYEGRAPAPASMSGFNNNFGHLLVRSSSSAGAWPGRYSTDAKDYALDVIRKTPLQRVRRVPGTRNYEESGELSSRNMLTWAGPPVDKLLANMSPAKLQWAFENLEFQMIGKPRETDAPEEFGWWLERIRPLVAKQNPARSGPYVPLKQNPGVDDATRLANPAGGSGPPSRPPFIYAQLINQIRTICAREMVGPRDHPYFSAHALPGETPNQTILRVFLEEQEAQREDGNPHDVESVVMLMCHG